MPRPSIKTPCTADAYADKAIERIAEFSAAKTEAGGLISLTERADGLHLSVYRTNGTQVHASPDILAPQTLRAAAKRWHVQNPGKSPDLFERPAQDIADVLVEAILNVREIKQGGGYYGADVQALKETARAVKASRAKADDLSGGDPGYRLITKDGPVILTLEAADNVIERKAAFATIADAEAYLNTSTTIDPVDLEAGRYGIDAPHGAGDDDEAVKIAQRLGFDIFMSMGSVYYSKGPHHADMSNWNGGPRPDGFQNVVHAAHVANSTVEP